MDPHAHATDWPLKPIPTATVIAGGPNNNITVLNEEAMQPTFPYQPHHGWTTEAAANERKKHDRKVLLCAVAAFVFSIVSLGLSIGITKCHGVEPHSHLLVAWITVSGGVTWLLGALVGCLVFSRPREVESIGADGGKELKGMRQVDGQHANDTATVQPPDSTTDSPFPLAHIEVRGRMPGQDYRRSRKGAPAAAAAHDPETPPIKPTSLHTHAKAHQIPFETHPNPLTSSPILNTGPPPPDLPTPEALRAQHYSRSVYTNTNGGSPPGSRTTVGTIDNDDDFGKDGREVDGDPFSGVNAKMEVRSASEVSLTAGYAQEVDVQVARSDSAKRIRAATVRRSGVE